MSLGCVRPICGSSGRAVAPSIGSRGSREAWLEKRIDQFDRSDVQAHLNAETAAMATL